MHEIVRVCLRHYPPFVRLLDKVLVALLLGKVDSVFFALEIKVRPLQEVARGLPSHQRVLPAMAFIEDIPVHSPLVAMPIA